MSKSELQSRLDAALTRPLSHSLLVVLFYTFLFLLFFSPSLVRGRLLAVGADGQNLYLPNFLGAKVFWDNMIFAGFPPMGDPQAMTWYPPALLFSLLPGSWNLFILLAYILTASFMYGYLLTITESKLAALTGSLTLGLSGFMMAHLGHAVIIHSVAWMPLLLWSYEKLRRRRSAGWFVAGSAAIALSFLGGHTPIFTLGFGLATAYAVVLGWQAPLGRWRYYAICGTMIVFGIALVAIQIVPTAEIAGQSVRSAYKFSDFVSHSLPPYQVGMLVFPKLFGGLKESGALPYYGGENLTELTAYVGLLPLLLASVGAVKWPQRALSFFWLSVAVIAVVLAMGNATPLASWIYHVPVVNKFRAPGRHLLEYTFAVCVLASLGVATLLKDRNNSFIRKTVVVWAVILIVIATLVFVNLDKLIELASHKDLSPEQVWRWTRWAVGIPLVMFLAAVAALAYWVRVPKSAVRIVLLLALLVLDLASFGWSHDWRHVAVKPESLKPPEIATRYQKLLADSHQRVLPSHGTMAPVGELPPNLTSLWGIPNASGYNSLILTRYSQLLNMLDVGSVTRPLWLDERDQGLNLAAIRYLFIPSYELTTDQRGISWQKDDMQLVLGSNCVEPASESITFNFPAPISSTAIGIVARLACAIQIPEGTEVVKLLIKDASGAVQTQSVLAGRDASEWAFDCNQVKPYMKHQRAQVFSTLPIKLNDESCVAHSYLTIVSLPATKDVSSIELKWVGGSGSMLLDKISFVNEAEQTTQPLDPLTIGGRWRFLEETNGSRVYENTTAQPRAWLVSDVVVLKGEQALQTVKTSKLPDGSNFDLQRTAIIEEPLPQKLSTSDQKATASVSLLTANVMEVHTSSPTAAFLVTSDVYYPGWQVSVDGQPVNLYRANFALRGVAVPAGKHLVKFSYQPRRFYLGVLISGSALLLLFGLLLSTVRLRPKQGS